MTSYFPDVNVWIALAYDRHIHHGAASAWFAGTHGDRSYFCRFSQLAFLRLLTQAGVMRGDALTQAEAWQIYDVLLDDPRISFLYERDEGSIELEFRMLTGARQSAPNQWADAYLAAFAATAGLRLVTFDRALSRLSPEALLLY